MTPAAHASAARRHDGIWFVLLRIPELLIGALVAVLVVFLTMAVFARYVMDVGLVWSDEAARLLFIWTVFLGFAVGLRHRGNIGIDLLVNLLPERWRRRMAVVQDALVLLFCVIFAWQAGIATRFSFMQQLPALQITIAWLYAAVLVSGVLMVVYAIANLLESLHGGAPRDFQGEDAAHRSE